MEVKLKLYNFSGI